MPTNILDKEKYKAVILYLAKNLGGITGKKKAYKLLYFLDFDFFEAYDKSLTGETYTALKMGPAPHYFDAVVKELVNEGFINIKKERKSPSHENDTLVYTSLKDINYTFQPEEKAMLDRIIKLYGAKTGHELEILSHAQAPYNAVSLFEVIPYEFSYYRDTADLTL